MEDGSRKKSEKNKQGKGTKSQGNHYHKNIIFFVTVIMIKVIIKSNSFV
jgi:hypothetical protein